MAELDPFAYLGRFAAARLIAWWDRLPDGLKWGRGNAFGIGLVKGALLGWAPSKPKIVSAAVEARDRLRAEMLGPSAHTEEE